MRTLTRLLDQCYVVTIVKVFLISLAMLKRCVKRKRVKDYNQLLLCVRMRTKILRGHILVDVSDNVEDDYHF